MSELDIPAPAPTPDTPAPVVATPEPSFTDFEKAHTDARQAKHAGRLPSAPSALVAPATEAPVEPPAPERTLSRRQEDANERTRKAVEAATADLRAEVAALKARTAEPRVETPPAPKTPEWKRYLALPDAPKLADFESVEEHAAAMADFVYVTRESERQTADHQRQTEDTQAKFLNARGQEYGERLSKAVEADPDIASKIAPPILQARPLSGLGPNDPRTFANAVAETGLFSTDPAALYVYLSAHPEEAASIAALPSEAHALRALAQLDGRLSGAPATAAVPVTPAPRAVAPSAPSTITAAPPPVPTISRASSSSDPKAAAFARGDFATFERIDTAERIAKRTHA